MLAAAFFGFAEILEYMLIETTIKCGDNKPLSPTNPSTLVISPPYQLGFISA